MTETSCLTLVTYRFVRGTKLRLAKSVTLFESFTRTVIHEPCCIDLGVRTEARLPLAWCIVVRSWYTSEPVGSQWISWACSGWHGPRCHSLVDPWLNTVYIILPSCIFVMPQSTRARPVARMNAVPLQDYQPSETRSMPTRTSGPVQETPREMI